VKPGPWLADIPAEGFGARAAHAIDTIMKRSKKIAFQGEPGANSHIACIQAYPTYEPLPCPTFEDAFAAVRTGRAALGMIPIDNSVAGRVADIHHLMPTSGLHIVSEWFLPLQHQLMAPKRASLDTIKTVESHIHALGQCRNVIRALHLKAVVAADTAGAAREVAEAGDVTRAALATKLAAKIYGLRIHVVNPVVDPTFSFMTVDHDGKIRMDPRGRTLWCGSSSPRSMPCSLRWPSGPRALPCRARSVGGMAPPVLSRACPTG